MPGDLVYVLGVTGNELGGSEYYEHLGFTGLNVPRVHTGAFKQLYRALTSAIEGELAASVHGVYRGGLGVHLAMVAMGGNLGMEIGLDGVPTAEAEANHRDDTLLFSESAGRFIVTVDPENRARFEKILEGLPFACVGQVTEKPELVVKGTHGRTIIAVSVPRLKDAWKSPFGDLI